MVPFGVSIDRCDDYNYVNHIVQFIEFFFVLNLVMCVAMAVSECRSLIKLMLRCW